MSLQNLKEKTESPTTEAQRQMNDIGRAVAERLPKDFGFFVLVFPFSQPAGSARAAYISNANREDTIRVMKEWLIRCGHKTDWMKDV